MIRKIHHIGDCVNNIYQTIDFYCSFTTVEVLGRKSYPERNQTSCMIRIGDDEDMIELMEPIGDEGVVASFLKKRGQGLHHVSLFTNDLNGTCE